MGAVEFPIRHSLRRFARAVDVEAVVQETFLRMWLFSQDNSRSLTGEDASLRFAIGLARNVARSEARRLGYEALLPAEYLPEVTVDPASPSDPRLKQAILDCIGRLARKPLQALRARMELAGLLADGEIAARLGMRVNTLLQNIVRARKQVAECLSRKGISLQELIP